MKKKSNKKLSEPQLQRASMLFATLSEPSRLRLLQALQEGSLSVGELVEATGLSQANVSKHLTVLHGARLVKKSRAGVFVNYELADSVVDQLCGLVCAKMERDLAEEARALNG
ncbi:ArsR/SmtB family transcription factor [Ereboglobus luteus]|nr:metalloregulator ArsR/SmtB family transcription factor [Ereboglobus luteus]